MEFVSFELAKKLKEKGFEIPTNMIFAMYNELGIFHSLATSANYSVSDSGFECRCYYDFDDFDEYDFVAPTIAQVLKWLRKEKDIHIELRLFLYGYVFDVKRISTKDKLAWSGTKEFENYEQAAIAGIKYVLDNLI